MVRLQVTNGFHGSLGRDEHIKDRLWVYCQDRVGKIQRLPGRGQCNTRQRNRLTNLILLFIGFRQKCLYDFKDDRRLHLVFCPGSPVRRHVSRCDTWRRRVKITFDTTDRPNVLFCKTKNTGSWPRMFVFPTVLINRPLGLRGLEETRVSTTPLGRDGGVHERSGHEPVSTTRNGNVLPRRPRRGLLSTNIGVLSGNISGKVRKRLLTDVYVL